jgi:hypothetical protein
MKRIIIILGLIFLASISHSETVRVVSRTDGGVTVIVPAIKNCNLTEEQNRLGLNGRPFKDMDRSEITADKKYRKAWKLDGNNVVVDSAKKTEIDNKLILDTEVARLKAFNEKMLIDQAKINKGLE